MRMSSSARRRRRCLRRADRSRRGAAAGEQRIRPPPALHAGREEHDEPGAAAAADLLHPGGRSRSRRRAGPGEHGLLRRPRAGDAEGLPRLLGLGPGGRVRPRDARHARRTTRRRGGADDRVRQGDGRHGLGRVVRPSTTRRTTAQNVYIQNPSNVLGGVWYDNTNPIHNNVTGLELAQEAQRAVAHFGVTDLHELAVRDRPAAEVQRGRASTPAPATAPGTTTRSPQYYPGVQPGISFTNMPYVLNQGVELRPELRQHRLLRRPARRVHDRHGPRDRGDDHRPRRRGRDQRRRTSAAGTTTRLGERRQVRLGRATLGRHAADRPSPAA